ncbi:hypothetical protein CCACVL1_25722 [Corchorus capsularis]|uniref:Uncharacterized protein n=1 Tax=Corchorus capsularis TaxID=210143 RepID=A0A1R3GHQ3_COCAP|nr:hypothetical protein CCACVL1_25722 [Corchorus capsularis]
MAYNVIPCELALVEEVQDRMEAFKWDQLVRRIVGNNPISQGSLRNDRECVNRLDKDQGQTVFARKGKEKVNPNQKQYVGISKNPDRIGMLVEESSGESLLPAEVDINHNAKFIENLPELLPRNFETEITESNLDANHNTALHIYSTTGGLRGQRSILMIKLIVFKLVVRLPIKFVQLQKSTKFVQQLLDSKENGELEQMLRMRDKKQNTALHTLTLALMGDYLNVARLLLKEAPHLSSSVYSTSETPLYIAAGRLCYDLVAEILDNYSSTPLIGPHGRTILHAATMAYRPGN